MLRPFVTLLLIIYATGIVNSQPEEFKSIDGIIEALYSTISGPAGERDWDYFRSIFVPGAVMGAVAENEEKNLFYSALTPESYIKNNGPFFLKNDFWEVEIGRETQQFGGVAHVYSAYKFEAKGKDTTINKRGINSIQLVFDSDRWWIVSLQWDSERPDNQIPAEMLNK